MADDEKKEKHTDENEVPDEEDYRESEDEDFDPNAAADDDDKLSSDDDGKDEELVDEGDEGVASRKRKKGHADGGSDNEEDGIRILTRSQRSAEDAAKKAAKKGKSTIDADALWAQMRASTPTAATAADEMITITETFEFAKEVTTRERQVPKNSAEGQAYLAKLAKEKEAAAASPAISSQTPSTASATTSATTKKPKLGGGPRKKKVSALDSLAAGGKPKKLNTLEKSKMDWQGFVDNEGITDDLRRHNQGGYLHKQDFLARVDEKRYTDLKEGQKALKKK
ncbi:bucentaur or craniofacial development-domain-containing protein [Myxozyma melibiosi]|uniref:SWR1-complex protein 5 n=1 Tax=Myxozyma melibiosi TaxID=54550 RepID=A0ABR1EYJ2_9ASCO